MKRTPKALADAARIDFEPWTITAEDYQKGVEQLGVKARIGWCVMRLTKERLMQNHRENPEMTREIHDHLMDGAAAAKAFAETMESAAARLLVSASAAETLRPRKKVKRRA